MKKPSEAINIVNLDHLGIVAGIIDEMELVEEVNKKVGIRTKETVSPGQVMKAMILNGLGFLSAPIYLFDRFFVGKATEHLIGEGVTPEQLNDDRIGRALDKYYKVGTTKLFTARWCRRFDDLFNHKAQKREFRHYLAGLLGESERKNLTQISDNAVGVVYHQLHHFLTEAPRESSRHKRASPTGDEHMQPNQGKSRI